MATAYDLARMIKIKRLGCILVLIGIAGLMGYSQEKANEYVSPSMLNAIEAMQDTAGELTIKTELGQGGQVLISVVDTGVGLPAEKTDQIFNAFFTTKSQGSGMGLAISRSIIESHRGRLWAISNDGRGATFHLTLPAEVTASPRSVA